MGAQCYEPKVKAAHMTGDWIQAAFTVNAGNCTLLLLERSRLSRWPTLSTTSRTANSENRRAQDARDSPLDNRPLCGVATQSVVFSGPSPTLRTQHFLPSRHLP